MGVAVPIPTLLVLRMILSPDTKVLADEVTMVLTEDMFVLEVATRSRSVRPVTVEVVRALERMSPKTCSLSRGVAVPTPTFPVARMEGARISRIPVEVSVVLTDFAVISPVVVRVVFTEEILALDVATRSR